MVMLASAPCAWLPRNRRVSDSVWREMPMMLGDVPLDSFEITWADRLGPIPLCPEHVHVDDAKA
jgi:hypothetical protein